MLMKFEIDMDNVSHIYLKDLVVYLNTIINRVEKETIELEVLIKSTKIPKIPKKKTEKEESD